MQVTQADGLELLADGSERLVVLNPPFHSDAALHTGIAAHLFATPHGCSRRAANCGACGTRTCGTVRCSSARSGPTRQIARNAKFTVTASTRRG